MLLVTWLPEAGQCKGVPDGSGWAVNWSVVLYYSLELGLGDGRLSSRRLEKDQKVKSHHFPTGLVASGLQGHV